MKKILFILFSIFYISFCLAQSSKVLNPTLKAMVTVNQYQDGKIRENTFYILEFSYIPKEYFGDEVCYVNSVTINNTNCSKESLGGINGFWIKPEYSSKDTHGDKFKCNIRRIDSEKWEFSVDEPVGLDGKFMHRLILKNDGKYLNKLLDYSGNLNKYSEITKKTEIAIYKPIRGKLYQEWKAIDMSCTTLTAPVISEK